MDGLIGLCRKKDEVALRKVDAIIRNTYRTLLSRAMKGCFVFCSDKALSEHLKRCLEENRERTRAFLNSNSAVLS